MERACGLKEQRALRNVRARILAGQTARRKV